jgi:VanZ family protein
MKHRKFQEMLSYLRSLFSDKPSLVIGVAFFAAMIAIGAIPGEADALSAAIPDKLLHFLAYSFLTCCLYVSISADKLRRAWISMLLVGVFGALDETIQRFMPYRSCDLEDWLFDMLAAAVSVAVISLLASFARQEPA